MSVNGIKSRQQPRQHQYLSRYQQCGMTYNHRTRSSSTYRQENKTEPHIRQRTQSRRKLQHNVNLTTDPTTTELNDQTNHHHGVPRSNQSYTSLAWKRNRHTSKGVVGNSNKTTTVTTTIQKKSQNAVINKNKLMWNDIKPQNLTQRSNPRTNKTPESESANAIYHTKSTIYNQTMRPPATFETTTIQTRLFDNPASANRTLNNNILPRCKQVLHNDRSELRNLYEPPRVPVPQHTRNMRTD